MLVFVYAAYIIISLGITVLAGRSLQNSGKVLLANNYKDNAPAGDAASGLFTAGFYLFCLAFIFIGVQSGNKPAVADVAENLEFLCGKLGMTVLFIAFVHLINGVVQGLMRK